MERTGNHRWGGFANKLYGLTTLSSGVRGIKDDEVRELAVMVPHGAMRDNAIWVVNFNLSDEGAQALADAIRSGLKVRAMQFMQEVKMTGVGAAALVDALAMTDQPLLEGLIFYCVNKHENVLLDALLKALRDDSIWPKLECIRLTKKALDPRLGAHRPTVASLHVACLLRTAKLESPPDDDDDDDDEDDE